MQKKDKKNGTKREERQITKNGCGGYDKITRKHLKSPPAMTTRNTFSFFYITFFFEKKVINNNNLIITT